ncbi:hypothetical protein TNCT_511201 [Trichonephila clavata]|uniref:Uncharacterized protein n=1 Tax=Trichonephila clavata TaxID=2740835 RepID=A0A8X6LTC0_TRICU|nr:hypothetical protein TNCT_511201 [Trichonephila clavata]
MGRGVDKKSWEKRDVVMEPFQQPDSSEDPSTSTSDEGISDVDSIVSEESQPNDAKVEEIDNHNYAEVVISNCGTSLLSADGTNFLDGKHLAMAEGEFGDSILLIMSGEEENGPSQARSGSDPDNRESVGALEGIVIELGDPNPSDVAQASTESADSTSDDPKKT